MTTTQPARSRDATPPQRAGEAELRRNRSRFAQTGIRSKVGAFATCSARTRTRSALATRQWPMRWFGSKTWRIGPNGVSAGLRCRPSRALWPKPRSAGRPARRRSTVPFVAAHESPTGPSRRLVRCSDMSASRGKPEVAGHRWRASRHLPEMTRKNQRANRLSIGAGEGNRTLVISLEGFCSTIELHPQFQ
jgi:hypothetical protein